MNKSPAHLMRASRPQNMRLLYKLFMYDIRVGFDSNKVLFLLAAVVFITLFLIFYSDCNTPYVIDENGEFYSLSSEKESAVDYLLFFFKGIKIYDLSSQRPFEIPILWLAIQISLALLVTAYPLRDLYSYAPQNIVRSQRKWIWWLAKCLWVILTVFAFYGICLLAALIGGIVGGGGVFGPNSAIQLYINNLDLAGVTGIELLLLMLVPVFVSVALSLVQVTLSLIIKPVFSFLVLMSYHLISTIVYSPFIIADYPMLLRNVLFEPDGLSSEAMILVSLCIAVIAIATGALIFKRTDIYPKNELH